MILINVFTYSFLFFKSLSYYPLQTRKQGLKVSCDHATRP